MCSAFILAAALSADFSGVVGPIKPAIHSSGFGPTICLQTAEDMSNLRSMGFKAARTHDWALVNQNQRVCDYFHIFPLMSADAKDPKSYHFGPTDYLLKRTREEMGVDVFFRLGTSIEHSDEGSHFNALIPEDFEKVAESFAATVRHYNRGWANGFKWGIKYWEIWNEPDGPKMWCLPDGDNGRGSTPEEIAADKKAHDDKRRALFARFFATCLKRLKSEFGDTIKVGGPALCSCDEGYFKVLFDACRAEGVAPDFISWHAYTNDPIRPAGDAAKARRFCDSYGFTDCELILNEWHYIGKDFGWGQLRSHDPAVRSLIWDGPNSHNGIESACFVLSTLANMQHSKLDQAYYYGCAHKGTWGYRDYNTMEKYKVYYALKLFGDIVRGYDTICESASGGNVWVFAASGDKGARKGVLVVDYGGDEEWITVDIKGVAPDAKPYCVLLDNTHDLVSYPVAFRDGKLVLRKTDIYSAAFFVEFD